METSDHTLSAAQIHAKEVLKNARTIAVVGFSANPEKPSHTAPMELVKRGWDVIPVNPTVNEIAGIKTVDTLADIDRTVDLVDVFRPSDQTPQIAEQAVAIGAKALWLQEGIASEKSREIAIKNGLEYVEDLCVKKISQLFDLHQATS